MIDIGIHFFFHFLTSNISTNHKTRNPDTIPAINYHDQVWCHVDKSPGHTDHVHVVVVEFHISTDDSCKQIKEYYKQMYM